MGRVDGAHSSSTARASTNDPPRRTNWRPPHQRASPLGTNSNEPPKPTASTGQPRKHHDPLRAFPRLTPNPLKVRFADAKPELKTPPPPPAHPMSSWRRPPSSMAINKNKTDEAYGTPGKTRVETKDPEPSPGKRRKGSTEPVRKPETPPPPIQGLSNSEVLAVAKLRRRHVLRRSMENVPGRRSETV